MQHSKSLGWLVATFAFVAAFAVLALATPFVLTAIYGWGANAADGSIGDLAGWATLISAPVLIPVYLILALVAATLSYATVVRRQID